MNVQKYISIDCGIYNTGVCVGYCEDNIVKLYSIEILGISKDIIRINNSYIKELTKIFSDYRDFIVREYDLGLDTLILIEQQPQINRNSCMVHDVLSSVFYQYDQRSIHPSKKRLSVAVAEELDVKQTGNWQKKHTKTVALTLINQYPELMEKYNNYKKKDDVADAICQLIYFVQIITSQK